MNVGDATVIPAAVEFDGVWYSYPGAESPALKGVSLRVEHGERLGVLGPNGGGKSTLLRLALGLMTPDRGTVRVYGMPPAKARRAGLIGSVQQRIEAELAFPLSARQVVLMGAAWRTTPLRTVPAEVRLRADRIMELVGVLPFADRPIGSISGGQLQRVMIARALATEPRILMLDEPTVGVDAAGQQRFAELMTQIHAGLRITLLTVSHDLRAIIAGSDRVACLSGTLHSHMAPEGLTPQVIAELFSHDVAGVLGNLHVHAHRPEDCDEARPVTGCCAGHGVEGRAEGEKAQGGAAG